MLPRDYLRARHDRRARRRTDLTALEALEERQLMAYSSLGFSLSDLRISGISAPTANWGGTVTLKITGQNSGAISSSSGTAQAPGWRGHSFTASFSVQITWARPSTGPA